MLELTFVKTLLQVNHSGDDECVVGKLFMSSEVLASCQTSNVCEAQDKARSRHDCISRRELAEALLEDEEGVFLTRCRHVPTAFTSR